MPDESPRLTVPPKPQRPKPPTEREPRSAASTASIVLSGLMLAVAMIGLGWATLGSIFALVIAGFLAVPIIIALHYLLWGWWLKRLVELEDDPEENSWDVYRN